MICGGRKTPRITLSGGFFLHKPSVSARPIWARILDTDTTKRGPYSAFVTDDPPPLELPGLAELFEKSNCVARVVNPVAVEEEEEEDANVENERLSSCAIFSLLPYPKVACNEKDVADGLVISRLRCNTTPRAQQACPVCCLFRPLSFFLDVYFSL